MYSIPLFGLLLNAVASDDDIISVKRDGRPSFIQEEIKRCLWSILTLYMDKLHRVFFGVILCDLRLINTAGQTKELF